MASVYLEADVSALVRLARLKDTEERASSRPGLMAMQALEDRYGLNPKSRRALQWEVTQAEQAERRRRGNVPKLRVVGNA